MIIYRTSDKIRLTFEEQKIVLFVSPLSHEQRGRVLLYTKLIDGKEVNDHIKMSFETLRYSIKRIDGVEHVKWPDGTPFELKFENGILTDDSTEAVIQILDTPALALVSARLLTNMLDFKIEGVRVSDIKRAKKKPR